MKRKRKERRTLGKQEKGRREIGEVTEPFPPESVLSSVATTSDSPMKRGP